MVTDQPVLDCQKQKSVYSEVGAEKVKITCRGNMVPAPVVYKWSFGKKGSKTMLSRDETSEDARFTATQEVMSMILLLPFDNRFAGLETMCTFIT